MHEFNEEKYNHNESWNWRFNNIDSAYTIDDDS